MAMLAGYGTFLLEAVIPRVTVRDRVLSVARMSITWDADDLEAHLRRTGVAYDSGTLARIRARGHVFTTREFFELLGFAEYEDIDLDPDEGVSIVHDLNTPVPQRLNQRFDLVFENGTIEHVFDLRTAMDNIARMVKIGGWVSHGSPLDAFNHGFYNLSMNFFNDYYRANGFTDLEFFLVRYSADWHRDQTVTVQPLEYTHEEFYVDPDVYDSPHNKMYIACVARKIEHVDPPRVPIQAAYDPALALDSRLTR